jgi:hypothetical protein
MVLLVEKTILVTCLTIGFESSIGIRTGFLSILLSLFRSHPNVLLVPNIGISFPAQISMAKTNALSTCSQMVTKDMRPWSRFSGLICVLNAASL